MISVIVPVYNVEQYLDECVKSILSQTYKDFELILVDDGSTDRSGVMCDEYAEKDDRIKVIHKKNGGLSDARNSGTRVAIGETITYIDSDDAVSKRHLEYLYKMMVENDADISVTGMKVFYKNVRQCVSDDLGKVVVLSRVEALEHMFYQNLLDTSACAILLRSDIAKNEDNLFPIGKYHEDDFTTYKYYNMANKIVVSRTPTYYYRQRSGSITHIWGIANMDELDAADNLVRFCEESYPFLVRAAHSKKFSNYCQALICMGGYKNGREHEYKRIVEYVQAECMGVMLDSKSRVKNRVAAAICCLGISVFELIAMLKVGKIFDR